MANYQSYKDMPKLKTLPSLSFCSDPFDWGVYAYPNDDADVEDAIWIDYFTDIPEIFDNCHIGYADEDSKDVWLYETLEELEGAANGE